MKRQEKKVKKLRALVRSHFGSRAISVQVNIVAVSDHVFHKFPFDLLLQVSLFLRIPFVFMANARTLEDALHASLPGSPTPLSSNCGSPGGSAPGLERMGSRPSTWEDKINEMAAQLAQMPLFLQSVSRVEKQRPYAFPESGHYHN